MVLLKRKQRIEKIKLHYPGMNFQEIAVLCGCTRMTIYRDFQHWIRSDDYEIWLHLRHMELLNKVSKEDPVNALKVINRLIAELRNKREPTPTGATIQVKMWEPKLKDEPAAIS